MKRIVLCAGKKCCPVLTQVAGNSYRIDDDYGSSVVVSESELRDFHAAAKSAQTGSRVTLGKVIMDREQALEIEKIF